MTRRLFVQAIGAATAVKARADSPKSGMGVAWTSFMTVAKPKDPLEFLIQCHELGAAGIQAPLHGDLRKLRSQADQFGMYLEAMVSLPSNGDTSAFEKSIQDAKDAGALCVRAAALSGRRYETFASLDAWRKFVSDSQRNIAAALPIVEKHKMPLALENHKDWTADEMAALMKSHSSEYLGVCLDFGNNIALLDDPMTAVETLAPYTMATHVKDMGVEWFHDGFLLSEMVLGQGFLDLPGMVATVRKARPAARLSLEMITRDPLQVPCLTDKYWTTFPDRSGVFLARTMQLVQKYKSAKPLPRMSGLTSEAQRVLEQENVRASLAFAHEKLS
ncbi:MAG TPA: sugar phosphate isomerase/epimerase family protein [Bryobacteraceae bacterium]|nr:sugar phosphate isomerase/epimerase family protein [Bryobacteraceae bacterium]